MRKTITSIVFIIISLLGTQVQSEIIQKMEKDGDQYTGGKILDPENGNVYRCKIWREKDKLYVRGYLGFFYRTQEWLISK